MTSFLISVLLVELFSVLVILSTKGKKNVVNVLIIFHSINLVKILFLCIWSLHKTGGIDLDYLQFPDEYYYVAEWHANAPLSNLYHLAVIGMRTVGFSISNLKVVNILISSYAIVRLYTLKDLVREKSRYVVYLLLLCGLLFLHVVYFSIFVLKDVLFFYVTVEFTIALIRRPIRNEWYLIALWAAILMLIRPPMVIGFLVFLFDRYWRLRWIRVLLFISLSGLLAGYVGTRYQDSFYRLIARGICEHTGVKRSELAKSAMTQYGQDVMSSGLSTYMGHVSANVRTVTLPIGRLDLTIQLILILEWWTAFYILILRRNLLYLIRWWPILLIALLYFVGGILTMYNIRYHVFPVTVFLCLSVFVAGKPVFSIPVRYREEFQARQCVSRRWPMLGV